MPIRCHPLRNLLGLRAPLRRGSNSWFALGMFFLLAILFSPVAAQNANNLKRAEEIYTKALQEKKTASRLDLLQKAAKLCEASDPAASSAPARRQVALIHWALGREYFQQNKWPAAVIHLEKAVAIDASLVSAYATLGLIYFQQKKYLAAIAAYNQVLFTQPSAQLYNNLGAAQEAQGDLAAAIMAYQRALEMEPTLLPAQKNLRRTQEKLALTTPAPSIATKIAAIDSAQLAAARRDSLAAAGSKKITKFSKTKTPQNSNATRSKTSALSSNVFAEKNKKEAPVSKNKTERTIVSPPPLPVKSEPPAANLSARRDSASGKNAPANKILTLPESSFTAVATNSSNHSALPYLCGAGVLLFGWVIFIQRHRLSRMWLQIRPALPAPAKILSSEERLLPATTAPRQEIKKIELPAPAKILPSSTAFNEGRAVTATAETASAVEIAEEETHQPSLQTQAFFAEMIAAEPELDNFALDTPENIAESTLIPATSNEHTDSALFVAANVFAHDTDAVQALTSSPIVVSAAELNNENGHAALPPVQTELLPNELAVISEPLSGRNDSMPVAAYLPQVASKQLSLLPYQSEELNNLPTKRSEDFTLLEKTFLGRYQLEREIGKGAMGKIYLARDPKLDRRVVIKTVCFNLAASDTETTTIKDRVYREARAIAKLSHPNIVVVYDVEDNHDLSYIVMEHIEGRDLRHCLKTEHRFEAERAVKIIAQVCSALDYAHQAGIIHRDIKPSNIMLLPNDKAKVTDFGIAKIADNFSLTLPGHVLGTPSYMAPEQFEEETTDSRADIFSLGVVLYELLTGTRPFAGDSLAALAYKIVHKMHIPPSLQNVELPFELDDILGRALAKQPEERYQTAQEFREALLAIKFPLSAQ